MDDFLLNSLSKEELLNILERVNNHLKQNYGMSEEEIVSEAKGMKQIFVPASIFSYNLSPAESIVKFLKEKYNLKFSEIGELINRDERGVWGSYRRATLKHPAELIPKQADVLIPVSVFANKKSIFESLVSYMKDVKNMKGVEISKLLNKKPSTIWTVYNRAKIKNNNVKAKNG